MAVLNTVNAGSASTRALALALHEIQILPLVLSPSSKL